ncbi:MAG TPA: ABC transporter permease [Pirellulales bacterium]|jgi:putative ABC transport system permease protein
MRFFTFVIKNLVRRRFRSLLTIAGIGLAVGAMIALVGISRGFVDSFLELYQGRGIDLVVVRSGVAERLTSALDESLGDKIRQLPGVKQVAGVMMDVMSFPELNLFGVPIVGWEPDAFMFDNLKLVSGRSPTADDGRVVMLGNILAKNMGKTTGDTLDVLEDEPFQIIGVFESLSMVENGSMIVTLAELQRLMDRRGRVNMLNVIAENRFDEGSLEQLRSAITAVAPGLSAMTTENFVTSDTQIRAARGMAWMTSLVALLIGSVGVLNTMVMSVFERTQEIGILRALGWRKSRVVRMILLEAILLSLGGALLGAAGAVGLTRMLSRVPAFSGSIASHIPLPVIAQGFLIALFLGLIGGLYPAVYGARLQPTEAIRHE